MQSSSLSPRPDSAGARTRTSRDAILEAARRLFASDRLERVSMRRISGACGLTLPVLYHYFEDKRALYRACAEASCAEAAAALRAALAAPVPARARLALLADALAGLLIPQPSLLAYVVEEAAGEPGVDATALAAVFDEADAVFAEAGVCRASPARGLAAQAIGQAVLVRLHCLDAEAARHALARHLALLLGEDEAGA